jgi:hypothetical protein
MPRKAAAGDSTDVSDPPRRSTRISSQPGQAIEAKPKTTAPKKATNVKKRNLDNEEEGVEQEDGEEAKAKKVGDICILCIAFNLACRPR